MSFLAVYKKLQLLLADKDLQDIQEEFEQYENNYDMVISTALNLLPDQKETGNTSPVNLKMGTQFQANIKLPSIGLPRFSGSYADWTEFQDSFSGIIDRNESLSKAQKLHYLKTALHGEAAKIVQSLKICDGNYDIAMSLLKERYEMKNLIVASYLRAIIDLEKVQKEDPSKLRHLSDTVTKSMRGLNSLGVTTENWDPLIIFIVVEKLDNVSHKEWQQSLDLHELPTWDQFSNFLNKRCRVLEAIKSKTVPEEPKKKPKHFNMSVTTKPCTLCSKDHLVQECSIWSTLNLDKRKNLMKQHKLCFRCLKSWHWKHKCRRDACSKCKGSHHVMLHQDIEEEEPSTSMKVEEQTVMTTSINPVSQKVLLSTACVFVQNELGERIKCRALLDNGAQSNFIRTEMCEKLRLRKKKLHSTICGITGTETAIRSQVDMTIISASGEFTADLNCLVIDKITDRIPLHSFPIEDLYIPNHIELADPSFNVSSNIDILLGANIFWKILGEKKMELGPISLRQTSLGWILAGSIVPAASVGKKTMVTLALQDCLVKFWQVEQCLECEPLSREQKACEDHFVENTSRDSTGRFTVKIPMKAEPDTLGESYQQAMRRLLSLEKRFRSDSLYKEAYHEFISEYLRLGHMCKVEGSDTEKRYFMPHHGVIKEGSTTTRLRTVFDSSAKTTSGYSYNEIQLVGPVVQNDLFSILVNFRQPKYAMTADVEKMYRQICVHPDFHKYQSILWRWNDSEPIEKYELLTVTYGTSSAPFLATRCIKQIALDVSISEPKIAKLLNTSMYVDDFLGGGDTVEETNGIALKLRSILQQYGFPLRKWLASDARVLNGIPENDVANSNLQLGDKTTVKTLGLMWNYQSDSLLYQIQDPEGFKINSKRALLSNISKIFDPLGLLAPSIILAKLLLQALWQENIKWDDPLPVGLNLKWLEFAKYLPSLNAIRVPRRVIPDQSAIIELHGFADASETAIGACVYFRTVNELGEITVRLVCAKSRVAPLRSETIPRLELCAAALLARLVNKVKLSLDLTFKTCVLWSDSTITLSWIRTEPYMLKQFVANRVAQIQNLNVSKDWRHVSSGDNPADLLSRGVRPDKLQDTELWWQGPWWLRMSESNWPVQSNVIESKDIPEIRTARIIGTAVTKADSSIFLRVQLDGMLRAGATALRWFNRSKGKSKVVGAFTPSEFDNVLKRLIQVEQSTYFKEELKDLRSDKLVAKGSCLFSLRPFIDSEGIIRVGGRLNHADLNYDSKHQIILPAGNELSRRLAETEHKRLLHCGQQQLLASLRRKYWPLQGRKLTKEVISKCVVCFKANPKGVIPIFGVLPAQRVLPSPPFFHTGVDYSGPYLIRDKRSRGYKTTKTYICVFVCLSTKAIHLELVSDLSTEGFIACLRRFISRRGKPKTISSDNATNFVGTNNELRELGNFLKAQNSKIHNMLLEERIEWRFIPPRSPNFGGLWEAGVKSVKRHLKRVSGQALLVFEEFYTLLTQIEAILNSRPLTPLSSDPNDLNPLTPGHFLIGRPLTSLIDTDFSETATNRLSRYQLIQKIVQNCWVRWSKEYLHELQQVKGDSKANNIKVGTLVILKEDNLPPCKWKTARVVEIFPGVDNVVRVVKVKTMDGIYKRAVRNVCVLPI